jgi:hypothetical protein
MADNESANVSESLADLSKAIDQISAELTERMKTVEVAFESLIGLLEVGQSLRNLAANSDLRTRFKKNVEGTLKYSSSFDADLIRKLSLIQNQFTLMAQMIELANKHGSKVL